MTRAIYDWLTCEKDLIVLPSAGHMLPVEYLGQTAPLVAEWLKTHLLAPSAPAAQETSAAAKADAVPAAPRKRAPRQAKKSEGASS